MLPAFKENWGSLATGQQAGLGDRKLLIAALPWKEWVWLRCDAKLLAGTASKCWKSCLLTLEWASLALWKALSLMAWGLLVLPFWVWVVWSGCTGAGLKKTGLWSASGCGGCFFCSSASLGSLMLWFSPVRVSHLSEATWLKDRGGRKMLYHALKF